MEKMRIQTKREVNDELQTSEVDFNLTQTLPSPIIPIFGKKRRNGQRENDEIYEKVSQMRTENNQRNLANEQSCFNYFQNEWSELSININSEIIQDQKKFKQLLNLNEGNFKLKLLYRASQNNFDVKAFHDYCEEIRNTVTVCSIKNGYVVGGFNPMSWDDRFSKVRTHYKTDKTFTSFLFNYTMNEKYPLSKISNNNAIIGCEHLGPTFGGGFDFSIGNNADVKYSSSCSFPTSYNSGPKDTGVNNKIILKPFDFTGIDDQCFLIEQWEVFEVFYPNEESEYQTEPEQSKNMADHLKSIKKSSKQQKGLVAKIKGFFS